MGKEATISSTKISEKVTKRPRLSYSSLRPSLQAYEALCAHNMVSTRVQPLRPSPGESLTHGNITRRSARSPRSDGASAVPPDCPPPRTAAGDQRNEGGLPVTGNHSAEPARRKPSSALLRPSPVRCKISMMSLNSNGFKLL